MLRRKRNPKGCKKAQKDCKKAQKDCKKSHKCLAIEPQLSYNRALLTIQLSLN